MAPRCAHHQRLRALCRQLQPSTAPAPTAVEMTTFEKQQRYVEPAPGAMFNHEAPESSTGYSAEETEAAVPRPALTPGERLHLEINGCERTRRPTRHLFHLCQPAGPLTLGSLSVLFPRRRGCERCVLEAGVRSDVQGDLCHRGRPARLRRP